MNILHNKLIVKFDEKHLKEFDLGGITIIRPDEWLHKEEDGKQKFAENTNYLETKPQIATVTHANSKLPYKVGDKLFLHYMAHETASYFNEETKEAFINADYVFMTFNEDGTYKMADGIYFGEQLFDDDEKTESGIIINVLGGKPKLCNIKLCHLPAHTGFERNEVVLTIDNYQYPLKVDGKDYIMLREREIIGKADAKLR